MPLCGAGTRRARAPPLAILTPGRACVVGTRRSWQASHPRRGRRSPLVPCWAHTVGADSGGGGSCGPAAADGCRPHFGADGDLAGPGGRKQRLEGRNSRCGGFGDLGDAVGLPVRSVADLSLSIILVSPSIHGPEGAAAFGRRGGGGKAGSRAPAAAWPHCRRTCSGRPARFRRGRRGERRGLR